MRDSWLDLSPQELLRVSWPLNFPEILIGLIFDLSTL